MIPWRPTSEYKPDMGRVLLHITANFGYYYTMGQFIFNMQRKQYVWIDDMNDPVVPSHFCEMNPPT